MSGYSQKGNKCLRAQEEKQSELRCQASCSTDTTWQTTSCILESYHDAALDDHGILVFLFSVT